MPSVERSIVIRCTPERAFDLSQDYALRLKWDPFLADLKFLDGATEAAVGVRTWVRSKRGMEMTAEYVAVERPHVVAIKMVEGGGNRGLTRLFAEFAGSWRFRDRGDGTTLVTMRYTITTRPRWARWAMEPVACWVFGRDVRGRLNGLRPWVENKGL